MKKFFKFLKKKAVAVTSMVGAMMVGLATAASAAEGDTNETVTSITNAFTTIKDTALAALGALAVIAIVLFGAIYAWRYAKKVFSIIAK